MLRLQPYLLLIALSTPVFAEIQGNPAASSAENSPIEGSASYSVPTSSGTWNEPLRVRDYQPTILKTWDEAEKLFKAMDRRWISRAYEGWEHWPRQLHDQFGIKSSIVRISATDKYFDHFNRQAGTRFFQKMKLTRWSFAAVVVRVLEQEVVLDPNFARGPLLLNDWINQRLDMDLGALKKDGFFRTDVIPEGILNGIKSCTLVPEHSPTFRKEVNDWCIMTKAPMYHKESAWVTPSGDEYLEEAF